MYAIVEVGGKQERVKVGDKLTTEKLEGEQGLDIVLDKVLLISDDKGNVTVGTPYIEGAKVTTTLEQQTKAPKLYVYKFKAKSRYRRKNGHRQLQTVLKINEIVAK
ncbi:MAG: 50S ribosomal protein L21 [bacterium]